MTMFYKLLKNSKIIKKYLPWIIIILYVLSPFDLVPDFIIGAGWLDDISIVAFVLWWLLRKKKARDAGHKSSSTNHESASTKKEQEAFHEDEKPEADPYKILGVEQGASKEEIKSAYMKLAAQYHPDKVQHLGKEFQELAHKKFLDIHKAYETLMG